MTIWLPQFIYSFYWTTSLAQYPCMTFTNVLESQIKFLTFLESKAGSGTPSLVPRPEEGEEKKGPGFSRSRMRLIISDLTTC